MLCLTRREGEWIDIGDNISILVLHSKNGRTTLGIDAPTENGVWRREIKELRDREQSEGTEP